MKLAPVIPPMLHRTSDQAKQTLENIHDCMRYCGCPTIAQFDTPQQVLCSLRDAILRRWKDWENTGKAHGNINSEIILIGNNASSTFGILSDSSSSPLIPIYKSVMSLKGKWPDGEEYVPDYLDDLESFYYVLGFISVCFTAPRQYGLDAGPPNPNLNLLKWMRQPRSELAIRQKEAALHIDGQGFTKDMISEYFKAYKFDIVLDEMHRVLKHRLHERKKNRSNGVTPPSRDDAQYKLEATQDHQAFLNAIIRRIDALEQPWKPPVRQPQPTVAIPTTASLPGVVALRRQLIRVITGLQLNPTTTQSEV